MGRKNWLFAGSDEGAERAAILCIVLDKEAKERQLQRSSSRRTKKPKP
jgi:hypothetical protein